MKLDYSGLIATNENQLARLHKPLRGPEAVPERAESPGKQQPPMSAEAQPEASGRHEKASEIFNLNPKKTEQLIFRLAFNIIQEHTAYQPENLEEGMAIFKALGELEAAGNDTPTRILSTKLADTVATYMAARGQVNEALATME